MVYSMLFFIFSIRKSHEIVKKPHDTFRSILARGKGVKLSRIRTTVQLTAQGNWSYTWNNLPKKNEEGTAYYYRVQETVPEDFTVTYNYPEEGSQATGVLEGTITLINTKESSFVLPETGGFGALQFAIAGLPLVGASGVVYLKQRRKRRRGGKTP